jgi:hypothetical protein
MKNNKYEDLSDTDQAFERLSNSTCYQRYVVQQERLQNQKQIGSMYKVLQEVPWLKPNYYDAMYKIGHKR